MTIAEKLQTIAENEQKVFDAGKKSEYDSFWDSFQNNGNRTDYKNAFFGTGWNEKNFKPKYDIRVVNGQSMFDSTTEIKDLKDILDKCGVVLDTSKATNLQYFLTSSHIEKVGVIDTTSLTDIKWMLYYCPRLKSVEKVILKSDGSQTFNNAFLELYVLEDLTIEGTIGKNGFDIQGSPKLSKASIENIIGCLSTTTSGLTVTLSKTAVDTAFTETEWATLIATKPNWTISLL